MMTEKNTFIHFDVMDEPLPRWRRPKSSPGMWQYLWDDSDDTAETVDDGYTSTVGEDCSVQSCSSLSSNLDKASLPCKSEGAEKTPWPISEIEVAKKAARSAAWVSMSAGLAAEIAYPEPADGSEKTCSSSSPSAAVEQKQPRRTCSRGGAPDTEMTAYAIREYVEQERNDGLTMIWHGLPTKCCVERDILPALERLGATELEYLYLPLVHWDKRKGRSKGYAFLHFASEAAAKDFAEKATEPIEFLSMKKTRTHGTGAASFQGISANILQLLHAPTRRGVPNSRIYLRVGGAMRGVSIDSLRQAQKENQSP